MNNDIILTIGLLVVAAFLFTVTYLVPAAGVVTGCVLLKKKIVQKPVGVTILAFSSVICLSVAYWKIADIISFH